MVSSLESHHAIPFRLPRGSPEAHLSQDLTGPVLSDCGVSRSLIRTSRVEEPFRDLLLNVKRSERFPI